MIKKRIGGKYMRATDASGYYGRNEAGNPQDFTPKSWGTRREFIGSRTNTYTFSDLIHGTHTFSAISYQDALRQALAMGYTQSDYKKR